MFARFKRLFVRRRLINHMEAMSELCLTYGALLKEKQFQEFVVKLVNDKELHYHVESAVKRVQNLGESFEEEGRELMENYDAKFQAVFGSVEE